MKTSGMMQAQIASAATQYKTLPVTCNVALGSSGNKGDYIEGVLAVVNNSTVSSVDLIDGTGAAINILPNGVGGGVGTYPIPLGLISHNGPWRLVTNNGVSAVATGIFS